MEDLISLINKLQDLFNTAGSSGLKEVELPQIVVIGIQVCYPYTLFPMYCIVVKCFPVQYMSKLHFSHRTERFWVLLKLNCCFYVVYYYFHFRAQEKAQF